MMPTFPGAAARLHACPRPLTGGTAWTVILATDPASAVPDRIARPGMVTPILTHDAGVIFPDATGRAIARAALAEGEVVALVFAGMGDAIACKRRLDAEAGR